MPIYIRNIRYYQKTGKGHLLETPITSQNIAQLERDIMAVLYSKGWTADASSGSKSLTISNIKHRKTGKRAPSRVYSRLKSWIATALERRNMRASITGSGK